MNGGDECPRCGCAYTHSQELTFGGILDHHEANQRRTCFDLAAADDGKIRLFYHSAEDLIAGDTRRKDDIRLQTIPESENNT